MTTTTHELRTPAAGGWFKSSRSTPGGECVEINFDQRDRQAVGHASRQIHRRLPAGSNGAVTVEIISGGTTLLQAISDGTALQFTKTEWRALLADACAREFDNPGVSITGQLAEFRAARAMIRRNLTGHRQHWMVTRDHYRPASVIGRFSVDPATSARERVIFVGRS